MLVEDLALLLLNTQSFHEVLGVGEKIFYVMTRLHWNMEKLVLLGTYFSNGILLFNRREANFARKKDTQVFIELIERVILQLDFLATGINLPGYPFNLREVLPCSLTAFQTQLRFVTKAMVSKQRISHEIDFGLFPIQCETPLSVRVKLVDPAYRKTKRFQQEVARNFPLNIISDLQSKMNSLTYD